MMVSKATTDILKLVRPDMLGMLGYEPIEPIDLLAERLGIPPERVVKLDGNENPYGPSPKAVGALANFDEYHRYPDPQQRRLRDSLAEYVGVGPEHIVAGSGSDELIDLVLRAVIAPGDGAIACPPTFGMYGFLTRVCGGSFVEVPRHDDFTLDIDEISAAAGDAKVIFVTSPNNPTGNPLRRHELDALLATGLLVVVDEAYVEFGGESFVSLVPQRENLIVLRTFSKWAGLAGLRAGYGILPAPLANVMMQIKQPYTPNIAAEVAALASLDDRDALMANVHAIVQERERMAGLLLELQFLDVYPSAANFVLTRVRTGNARSAYDRMAQHGVFVRYFAATRLADCLRISVGLPSDTDRVIEALQEQGGKRG
ncbi:MAG: histidinol-phosphate transaminase [Dehalococcoidia bacterium]